MKPSREVRNVILGFYHDMGEAGPNATDGISTAADVRCIGTDPDEYWSGAEVEQMMRAQVLATGQTDVRPVLVDAFEEGSVGWASSHARWTLPDGNVVPLRFSFVVHREDGDWRIVQMHVSVGVGNVDAMGDEVATRFAEMAEIVDQERPDMSSTMSPDGTITIMFTDMESSTATNERLGDDRFLPLLLRHNEIVREHTRANGGSVVKSQGDGFMLAFQSARRGVECAIAVQRDVAALDAAIRVRMGLHTGEPVRSEDDFFGRDVAYAARLGAAATGGEILVSTLVKSLVEPSGSFAFDGPRDMELKGFEGPQPVFAVRWTG